MSELEELRREVATLRQQLGDANAALEALARGEVDAVAHAETGSTSPILLGKAQEELKRNRALLRAVFDESLDALLLADDDGRYVDANAAASALFRVPREQIIGRRIVDFATPDYDVMARFQDFLKSGRMTGHFPLRRLDGSSAVVDFSAVANVVPGLHLSALRDVTDRVAAEVALQRREARFRAMIERSQDGISLLGPDLRTIYQSPGAERLLGYTTDESGRMNWQEFVDADERPKLERAIAGLMKGAGATVNVEFRIRKKDGSPCWLELTATNWLDDPDIGAIVTNFRDITERMKIAEEREGFFRLSLDLLCIAGVDGRFRRLNPAWETTLGWSIEELCAHPWLDFVHPDDRAATEREGARLAQGQVTVRFENRYRCKDGSYRWLQWACIPTSDGLIYACAHDVTAQRTAAQRDRILFKENPIPMLLTDVETHKFLDANDAAVRVYGYSREELLSMRLDDLVVREQHASLSDMIDTLVDTGSVFIRDRQHRTKDGDLRDIEVTAHRVDIDGRPAILSVLIDVTEARRLEVERARHVERLRLLEMSVSRLNDVVLITKAAPLSDPGPEIVYVNAAFERVSGYSPAEAIGKTPRMLQGPNTDRGVLDSLRAALERAEPARVELVNYRKSGEPYWLEIDIAPVRDDAGELTHFVAVERDVSERHRAAEALVRSEERLRQAQKMEAIGSLAGGVAHDFNNLLSVILSYTSLIMEELPPADPIHKDLSEVHRAGLRASEMTRQLLAFSRKQILQPDVIDVGAIVTGMEKMLRRIIGEDIDLTLHCAPDAGKVFADPTQIEQVIMNLVVNARDAMPSGGNLTVETSRIVLDEAFAATHANVTPGPYVLVAVTDTGIGMDRATQERIFEPFFTTKGQGKGTGLGLSTVYGIVRQSGGYIWVYSEPSRGTTFKVYFPCTERVEEAPRSAPEIRHSLRGTETVLLVEDEAPVREVVRSILHKNGYHVLEAENGGEAFLMCEQFGGTIHLLLTDVVMPRMSGRQLAERLVAIRPLMKVLFVSGYTENTIVHHGVLDAGIDFLAKPITPEPLLRKVRQVLDGRSRPTTFPPR